MQVIFWNIQRLKNPVDGNSLNERGHYLLDTLTRFVERYQPEFIILCEGAKGLRKALRERAWPLLTGKQLVLNQYEFVKPHSNKVNLNFGGYTDENTLRYVILRRTGVASDCFYVTLYNFARRRHGRFVERAVDRPGVVINTYVGGKHYTLAALHAVSAGQKTATPQSSNVVSIIRHAHVGPANLPIANVAHPYARPHAIFGDMNIDANDPLQLARLAGKFNQYGDPLCGGRIQDWYEIKSPTGPTRGSAYLDWALVRTDQQGASVENADSSPVIPASPPVARKRGQASAAVSSVKSARRKVDDDDDDGDEFFPTVHAEDKSDHGAIVVTLP